MAFRIQSILAGSDASEAGRDVLRTAIDFAALTGSEIHVVYAAENTPVTNGSGADPVEAAAERLRAQVRQATSRGGKLASLRVVPGAAHEVILRRAEEVRADLIVVGPHRGAPDERGDLGTTADKIVRTSSQPCLIVRGLVSLPLRSVLVPTDLSSAAQGALDLALNWASALRVRTGNDEETRLDVLHVLTDPSTRTQAERTLQDEVVAAGKRTGSSSLLRANRDVVETNAAADEILRRAKDGQVDLLVLGTHGGSAMERSHIGSVSSEVARRAECALLLAPPGWWQVRQAREKMLNGGSTDSA